MPGNPGEKGHEMIGTIDIEVNAANPQKPLRPLTAFAGSPSQVRLRNVPRAIGAWRLTDVRVRLNNPDGTSSVTPCTLTGGVWCATVPGTETPGISVNGFVVEADGDDEHGGRVENYVLGVGDVEILNRENAVTPETQTFKGDPGAPGENGATPVIGENGNWWIGGVDTGKPARGPQGEPGDVPVLSTTFTAQDAGKAADAKAVGDKIADCMTKVTTLKINDEWRFSVAPGLSGGIAIRLEHLDFPLQGIWGIRTEMTIPTGLGTLSKSADVAAATKLTPVYGEWTFDVTIDQVNAALESYNAELVVDSLEVSFVDGTWSLHSNPVGFGGKANGFVADDIDATELYFPYNGYGLDVHATRAIIGYRLGTDENAPILIEADEKTDEETGKTIYELPDPIKSALFSGKGFKQAVKKAGGFQHDENGYYIEVEEA